VVAFPAGSDPDQRRAAASGEAKRHTTDGKKCQTYTRRTESDVQAYEGFFEKTALV
jgi:hypothetical protein